MRSSPDPRRILVDVRCGSRLFGYPQNQWFYPTVCIWSRRERTRAPTIPTTSPNHFSATCDFVHNFFKQMLPASGGNHIFKDRPTAFRIQVPLFAPPAVGKHCNYYYYFLRFYRSFVLPIPLQHRISSPLPHCMNELDPAECTK